MTHDDDTREVLEDCYRAQARSDLGYRAQADAYNGPELDNETLEQAAREVLERPSNAAMWDDRLYRTHGPVISWAERGDDVLAESNYHAMLELVTDAAGADADEHVIDATISDWLVGSLRQVFVQVRTDTGGFTPAFASATEAALALRDYPVLDETDHSEREWSRYESILEDAIRDAASDHPEDADEERETISERVREGDDTYQLNYPDPSWTLVAEVYGEVRNAYFTERAEPYVTPAYVPTDVYAKTDDITPAMF